MDAVKTYINEPGFREYYAKFLALRDVEMTHRERSPATRGGPTLVKRLVNSL